MGGGACFATPFVPEHEGKPQLQKKKKNFAYLHTFRPEGRRGRGQLKRHKGDH